MLCSTGGVSYALGGWAFKIPPFGSAEYFDSPTPEAILQKCPNMDKVQP